jgi:hypothetical protein
VEDDSSWIGWNRIHDFYDDHPYGNNHTWVATLDRLKKHIAERTAKPLVLGEAIAADTWVEHARLRKQVGDERPFWLPRFFDANRQWMDRMEQLYGPGGLEKLSADSRHYGLLMRKYQIETYRREVPFGGYVVSVIRDIPLCSMGLIDYRGEPKWPADQWSWHGDTMLLLQTAEDRRSFSGGETWRGQLAISHFDDFPIRDAVLELTVRCNQPAQLSKVARKTVSLSGRGLSAIEPLEFELPQVQRPLQFVLEATLTVKQHRITNHWPMWVVPWHDSTTARSLRLHPSCGPEIGALFPGARPAQQDGQSKTVVTARLDGPLLDFMRDGGSVLLLPNGEKGSFPVSDQWFLRGAPYIPEHPLLERVPRNLLIELQHFDLAGPVIPDIQYLEQIDPLLMLWNNHDLEVVKTQGLVFESCVGSGRLLVSALRHTGETNAAGRWLAQTFVQHLTDGPMPERGFAEATIELMKAKIKEQRIDLTQRSWEFRPDPENQGLQRNWHRPTYTPGDTWKEIRIGRAWEGLGYPTLDGWAWYRTKVKIPESWKGEPVYVAFEGVDDYYELYVNGNRAGSGGDIETRTTAFDQRKSHEVTEYTESGREAVIAVRVYDWYGAGGLFRPVVLSTAALGNRLEVLK